MQLMSSFVAETYNCFLVLSGMVLTLKSVPLPCTALASSTSSGVHVIAYKFTHLCHSDSSHPHFEEMCILCTKHLHVLGSSSRAGRLDGGGMQGERKWAEHRALHSYVQYIEILALQ